MLQNPWKILTLFAIFGGAAWIWISRTSPDNLTNGMMPAPQQGFQAPDFELVESDGKTIQLSSLRGNPVLINFWASWCAPCKAEMPAMEHVYQKYGKDGLQILAINSSIQDNRSNALAFTSQLGLSFPILFDENGIVSNSYKVRALPTSFFVDRQGIVRDVVIGGPMAEALLEIRVQQLLELPP
jgi:cytochrome c biogenesis protein CcmG, thiol:disulfide interchange protein DsbE